MTRVYNSEMESFQTILQSRERIHPPNVIGISKDPATHSPLLRDKEGQARVTSVKARAGRARGRRRSRSLTSEEGEEGVDHHEPRHGIRFSLTIASLSIGPRTFFSLGS